MNHSCSVRRSAPARSITPSTPARWAPCRSKAGPTCWSNTAGRRRSSKTFACGLLIREPSRCFARAASNRSPCRWPGRFDLLFRPEVADAEPGERAITEDETEIGYYGRSGLLLEDVVREQVLLTLPGRTLCGDDCKGLCASCGGNLNSSRCDCAQAASAGIKDVRWSALQGLALKQ